LEISKKTRIGSGVPFTNNNLIGFVQINDSGKIFFEEIAGREGIIEKEAFRNLQSFVSIAIEAGFRNFVSKFKKSTAYKEANKKSAAPVTQQTVQATLSQIQKASETLSADDKTEEQKAKATETINKAVESLTKQTNTVVGELEMLRVLAGVGLTIGEFIHEVKQFTPSFSGYITNLKGKKLGPEVTSILSNMQDVFTSFQSYTAYFDATISQNVLRELHPIDLRDAVEAFEKIVKSDLVRRGIELKTEFKGWDLLTQPMHVSEWNTILQNLYSNSKKAILRTGRKGKILIKCGKSEEKLVLSFCDNGDGIEEQYHSRIFDAFYTSSTPVSSATTNEVTGTGLGLHILKQIIVNRHGKIFIDEPFGIYKTCISIELPLYVEN